MKARILRPVPGSKEYKMGEVYDFEGDTQWLVKGRYIQPVAEKPQKAIVTPETR